MIDPRTFAAFDLPPDATGQQIAARMRELAGLPPDPNANTDLWTRFFEMVEWVRTVEPERRGDIAEFANGIASGAIVPPRRPGENRWGTIPWDRELGVGFAGADDVLRGFVFDVIGPRLEAAGLYELW